MQVSVLSFAIIFFCVVNTKALRDCREMGSLYQVEHLIDPSVNFYVQAYKQQDYFVITLSASVEGFLGFGMLC